MGSKSAEVSLDVVETHYTPSSVNASFYCWVSTLVFVFPVFRSKDIEASSGNGDMAFQEVRIQQSVVEFILNHADQIFSSEQIKVKEGMTFLLLRKNVELKHFLSYQRKKQHFIFLQDRFRSVGKSTPRSPSVASVGQ